jgi:hypothetical protein
VPLLCPRKTGQIVNGKTKIVELASKMILGASYSAVYYRNSDSKTVLAASALRTSSDAVTVDVPLPSTDWLDKLRLSATWADDAQVCFHVCRHCTLPL